MAKTALKVKQSRKPKFGVALHRCSKWRPGDSSASSACAGLPPPELAHAVMPGMTKSSW